MKKKVLAVTLGAAMLAGPLAGCGEKAPAPGATTAAQADAGSEAAPGGDAAADSGNEEAPAEGGDLSGDLVFAIWDNNLMDYIDENDMVCNFHEKLPADNIEFVKL